MVRREWFEVPAGRSPDRVCVNRSACRNGIGDGRLIAHRTSDPDVPQRSGPRPARTETGRWAELAGSTGKARVGTWVRAQNRRRRLILAGMPAGAVAPQKRGKANA